VNLKHFELAKEALKKKREEYWSSPLSGAGGTGDYRNVLCGAILSDTSFRDANYPCHNPIRSYTKASILWSAFGYRLKKSIAEYYFDWLIHTSPWSKTGIIPKTTTEEYMFEQGFIFTDLDKTPANLLHNFLIASRMAVEWPQAIKDWYYFVTKEKLNPDLVFFFLYCFTPINQSTGGAYLSGLSKGSESIVAEGEKYDWPLDCASATPSYLDNFLKGVTPGISKINFYPTANTPPVNTLWGKTSSEQTYKDSFVRIFKGSYVEFLHDTYRKKYSSPRTIAMNLKGGFRDKAMEDQLRQKYERVYTPEAIVEIVKEEQKRLGL
jgi:hypothetical protein